MGRQTVGDPTQAPFWQVSGWVQALLSLQAVPLGLLVTTQSPVEGLHRLEVWHGVGAGQVTRFDPVQMPFWQTSVWVQRLPSLHGVPVRSVQVPLDVPPAATEQASQAPAL